MKEPKDKRTKQYKEWKKNFDKENSTGLGDVVEKVAEVTGVKKLVTEFSNGKDCGCDKRKEKLNKLRFRFKPVRCFTEEQFNAWTNFKQNKSNQVTRKEQTELIIPIFRQLFARQLKPMSCCVKQYIDEIDRVYEAY